MEKDKHQFKLNITLQLDEKRVSNLTEEGLREYLKSRLDYSLGFRGQVKKISRPRKK